MKIEKDSLVKKIIEYNAIAIIITTICVTFFLVVRTFKNMDEKMIGVIREKVVSLSRASDNTLVTIKNRLYKILQDIQLSTITNEDGEVNYQKFSEQIHKNLDKENSSLDDNMYISILSENGRLLGEYGKNIDNKDISHFNISNQEILSDKINIAKRGLKDFYMIKLNGQIYVNVISPLLWLNEEERTFVLFTIPINNLIKSEEIKDFMRLTDLDQLFIVNEPLENFPKDLVIENEDTSIKIGKQQILKNDVLYTGRGNTNDNKRVFYYIKNSQLNDYAQNYIGSMVVALDRTPHLREKLFIFLYLLAIMGITVYLSNIVCKKVFYSLLKPLSKIVEASESVIEGNYKVSLESSVVGEVRKLTDSFEKMVTVIEENEKDLTAKNKALQETLHKLNTIEKIIMGINIEDDINVTVKGILAAITSEIGLGYSRAMYFRYSREIDTFVGEMTAVNSNLKKNEMIEDEKLQGFQFQINEIDKLVNLIKIPYKNDSLFRRSLKEKRGIYFNDKGYKYDLGNELFQSMGINNFMIFPIFTEKRNYGCVLVDYFVRNKKITKEDLELITLLFMNISMKITNKDLEEEKIDRERILTVEKLSEKFLDRREIAIEKLFSMVDRFDEYNIQDNAIQEGILDLKGELSMLNREVASLRDYSEVSKIEFEAFSLEEPIKTVTRKLNDSLVADGITLSVFLKHKEKILGDRKKIEKLLSELIKNSQDALNYKNNSDKKINIEVTEEKHIDKIRITIKDNGIGIPEEHMKNIFEPFVSHTNSPGLGLAIVARIVKNHMGVIKIKSKKNEGTEVKITLNLYKEDMT